jgi:hypothetical protein
MPPSALDSTPTSCADDPLPPPLASSLASTLHKDLWTLTLQTVKAKIALSIDGLRNPVHHLGLSWASISCHPTLTASNVTARTPDMTAMSALIHALIDGAG